MTARVLFAHHSVGADILDGLAHLPQAEPLAIDEVAPGRNGDPRAKIDDFATAAIAANADDVALLKLCFADFTPSTDVDALARSYEAALTRIRAARPALVIVHTTPALHTRPRGAKVWAQRALGRPVWGDDANAKRAAFADWIRRRFAGEPLFDLARVESTTPNGDPCAALVDGKPVPALWDGYSTDGGHLNPLGKQVAAKAFLAVLTAIKRA